MKKLIVITALFFSLKGFAGDDILKVRDLYYRASVNKEVSDSFYNYLNDKPQINASLLYGYRGMSYLIKANHSWNPYNKLSFFTKGKSYLNAAIENDQKNIELRFLRYCVQTNAPAFLNYRGEIYDDKSAILRGYLNITDADLKSRIKNYMITSSYCTENEKAFFK